MLICITGIDGCGKGVQVSLLEKYLTSQDQSVFVSKAYGTGEKEIFSTFLEYWDPLAILFLFQALHVEQRIRAERALLEGKLVIADRWDESYLAYHSNYGALSTDAELREKLNQMAFGGIVPNITFLLKVSIQKAKERCRLRGEDFFDRASLEYHETMQNGYLALAEKRGWTVLDGEMSIRDIHQKILSRMNL